MTIQQFMNAESKSTSHSHPKILMLSLHDATTLENWRRRFDFVSEKMIQQLLTVVTDVEITDFNVSKSSKEESQPLIEFYKLANSKCQIS